MKYRTTEKALVVCLLAAPLCACGTSNEEAEPSAPTGEQAQGAAELTPPSPVDPTPLAPEVAETAEAPEVELPPAIPPSERTAAELERVREARKLFWVEGDLEGHVAFGDFAVVEGAAASDTGLEPMVRARSSAYRRCYETALRRDDAALEGDIEIEVSAGPDTTTAEARVVENETGSDTVGACITGFVSRTALQEELPEAQTVRVRLTLRPIFPAGTTAVR